MGNELETRVSRLEKLTQKLGKSSELTNEVLSELITDISDEIKGQVKEEMVTREKEIESNVLNAVSDNIEATIDNKLGKRGLIASDAKILEKARKKRVSLLLGGINSDRYILYSSFYFGRMCNRYKEKFNVDSYNAINQAQFKEALDFVQSFEMGDTSWCTKILHNDYKNGELKNNKIIHAYERHFGISK